MGYEKPEKLPRWADDPTDPVPAVAIVEPSEGRKSQGWVATERPPFGYFNWFFNLVYSWTAYLDSMITAEIELRLNLLGQTFEATSPKSVAINDIETDGFVLVAVGAADGGDALILSSADRGATWTERANPKNISLNAITKIGYTWVAVGDADGTDSYILTSTNLSTWTEQAPTVSKNINLYDVNNNGKLLVAIGANDGTDTYILTSDDFGSTWTEQAAPGGHTAYSVIWNGEEWISWPFGAADPYTSADGTTWTYYMTTQDVPERGIRALCNTGNRIIGVGNDCISQSIMVSDDGGHEWLKITNPIPDGVFNGIISDGKLVIAFGTVQTTYPIVIVSYDNGASWIDKTGILAVNDPIIGAIWDGHGYVFVGGAGGAAASATILTSKMLTSI